MVLPPRLRATLSRAGSRGARRARRLALSGLVVAVAAGASGCAGDGDAAPAMRGPSGVYVVFWPVPEEATQPEARIPVPGCSLAVAAGRAPSPSENITNNACGLLRQPSVSGLLIVAPWSAISPAEGVLRTGILDDTFTAVHRWNAANPNDPKTVQLGVDPGFSTPAWFFDSTTVGAASCDGLFTKSGGGAVAPDCDYTSIFYQNEVQSPSQRPFPLPWSARYKAAWRGVLTALAARYEADPVLVGVQIAGPTASSEEMILPNASSPNDVPLTLPDAAVQAMDASVVTTTVSAVQAWNLLLANRYGVGSPEYDTDQAFIEEWESAIDTYGEVFSGVTLSLSTGNGFPDLKGHYTLPSGLASVPGVCGPQPAMECAAVWTILQYFTQPGVGGSNAKSSQMDGLTGDSNGYVLGPKLLASATAEHAPLSRGAGPTAQVLGGLQEGKPAATDPEVAGDWCPEGWKATGACVTPAAPGDPIPWACAGDIPRGCIEPGETSTPTPSAADPEFVDPGELMSVEQALYNLFGAALTSTAGAASFGAAQGHAPLSYVQVWAQDVRYALENPDRTALVATRSGATARVSAASLLSTLSQALKRTGEPIATSAATPPAAPPPVTPVTGVTTSQR